VGRAWWHLRYQEAEKPLAATTAERELVTAADTYPADPATVASKPIALTDVLKTLDFDELLVRLANRFGEKAALWTYFQNPEDLQEGAGF
jgi:hypothetical protein